MDPSAMLTQHRRRIFLSFNNPTQPPDTLAHHIKNGARFTFDRPGSSQPVLSVSAIVSHRDD